MEESSVWDGGPPVIAAVGLATAQGGVAELSDGAAISAMPAMVPPAPLPWPADRRTTSGLCRPALGLDPGLA
ncbi:MAG: hypothetical protein WAM82_24360, partial [Thermoanaerobaculia bacterium]